MSSVSSVHSKVYDVENALRVSVPTAIHQNYRLALVLARAVKAMEIRAGKPFTQAEHRDIHAKWLASLTSFQIAFISAVKSNPGTAGHGMPDWRSAAISQAGHRWAA